MGDKIKHRERKGKSFEGRCCRRISRQRLPGGSKNIGKEGKEPFGPDAGESPKIARAIAMTKDQVFTLAVLLPAREGGTSFLKLFEKGPVRAKDGTDEKVFDALGWLAGMCSHIPDREEQMVRYYGYYSNVSRGKRKETKEDGVPCILEADKSSKEYRKNWARLIQKIYEVDPLTCPKCWGSMRIISFIEDREVIKTILKRLGL